MKAKKISLKELLEQQNKQLDISIVTPNDVTVIPDPRLTIDDIFVIKKIRKEGIKVNTPNLEDIQYEELRGGEFELALMIISQTALPIVLSVTSAWIYDKIRSYKQMKNKIRNEGIKRPPFKIKYYFLKRQEYVEIEGEPDKVLEALDNIRKDDSS